jgi:hypothetical protein
MLAIAILPATAFISGSASAGAISINYAPIHRLSATSSTNWSGYATTAARPYTSVSASWVEPTARCTSESTFASFWDGIDGFNTNSVEQNGTSVDCSGGIASYFAWYEMFPANPVNYGNTVRPGDHFTASVTDSGTSFTLTISDVTRGWSHTQHKSSARAQKGSAEVIAEAPSLCSATSCTVAPLTNFGTVNFTASVANGTSIGSLAPISITMAAGRVVEAQPSALSGGRNFSVVWHHN